jgi:hypothetical protein
MKAQTDYTHAVLNSIPGRQQMMNLMKDFDKRVSAKVTNLVITNNDVYFYLKTTPGDEAVVAFAHVRGGANWAMHSTESFPVPNSDPL